MQDRYMFFNGSVLQEQWVHISPLDHGFLYGDGIFEGIRCYDGRVFKLDQHIARLFQSARSLLLQVPYSHQEMVEAVVATVRANNLHDAYIRVVISRGIGDLGLDPTHCHDATVLIIADTIQLFPENLYDNGISMASANIRRPAGDVLNPQVKSLNYLNSVLAKIEASQRGVQEVVMLNQLGHVVEGTGDNIFIVRMKALITPPLSAGILAGITRATIMELACQEGLDVREENFTLHDLYNAEECFLTGTAAEVIGAIACDGRKIGEGIPGPITATLRRLFMQYARSEGTEVYGVSLI